MIRNNPSKWGLSNSNPTKSRQSLKLSRHHSWGADLRFLLPRYRLGRASESSHLHFSTHVFQPCRSPWIRLYCFFTELLPCLMSSSTKMFLLEKTDPLLSAPSSSTDLVDPVRPLRVSSIWFLFYLYLQSSALPVCDGPSVDLCRACLWCRRISSSTVAATPSPIAATKKGVKKKVLNSLHNFTATLKSVGKFSDYADCLAEFDT
ncbi:hypothetical protein PIB30_076312 [Stylosanthes scabra]|uniref:Uncharacterized protein n=1 Tax=Stylosanthes scabra TaxID=79078 RepID=A0ABU6SQD8_9FABA|nr:hypothetical protein [Stylosanthes scabra]